MPNIPECANHLQGSCERSNTFVEGERHNCFVIKCRTCGGVNIWPFDKEEKLGKYTSFLKHQAAREAQQRSESLRRSYSLPTSYGVGKFTSGDKTQ